MDFKLKHYAIILGLIIVVVLVINYVVIKNATVDANGKPVAEVKNFLFRLPKAA